ncbi:hypothetical protein [Aureimonas leprariae]|uniref:Uncharacterized protein n=1 Tax=Plantimonas leprariae TaxID=2615207 RepID=A0A7V7PRE0_9HYPH|nr:hypothetical protein [Aureimonas leprariae]KAB0681318.1 hypothetical protein F6X38_05360 [Aureimonas leprariae]
MIRVLCSRLEIARSGQSTLNAALETDLLRWLFAQPDFDSDDNLLRHSRGLVGNLTGAVDLQVNVLPDARLTFDSRFGGARIAMASLWTARGGERPFVGLAVDPANAVLVATLRAYTAHLLGARPANDNDTVDPVADAASILRLLDAEAGRISA